MMEEEQEIPKSPTISSPTNKFDTISPLTASAAVAPARSTSPPPLPSHTPLPSVDQSKSFHSIVEPTKTSSAAPTKSTIKPIPVDVKPTLQSQSTLSLPTAESSTVNQGIPSTFSWAKNDEERRQQLKQMEHDQIMFFDCILPLRYNAIIYSSNLLTADEWLKQTPDSFFSSRSAKMKAIDQTLASYHYLIDCSNDLIRSARLVCAAEIAQGSTAQIGFCFPGFDSQVVDVGAFSVISFWSFFESASSVAYSEEDLQGALNSSLCAAELMQSTPDVTQLYEDGKMEEAKTISHDSTLQMLHNITLAAYLKQNFHQTKKASIQSGDM